jgi:hypothetical protein
VSLCSAEQGRAHPVYFPHLLHEVRSMEVVQINRNVDHCEREIVDGEGRGESLATGNLVVTSHVNQVIPYCMM